MTAAGDDPGTQSQVHDGAAWRELAERLRLLAVSRVTPRTSVIIDSRDDNILAILKDTLA